MSTDDKVASCIGILAAFAVTTIVGAIMNGWALAMLWAWFIVPIFNLPTLSIVQAIGIGMVVSFLTRHSINKEEPRPDYIKCIRHTHEKMKTTSWCGREIPRSEWHFVDIDHAAYNVMSGGRLLACESCISKIVEIIDGDSQESK